ETPTLKRKFRFRHVGIRIRAKLKRALKTILYCFCCRKFCFKLRHEGSCENYVLKSFLGFMGGMVLTYIFFMFFVFQLNFKVGTATIVCSVFGCFLVNGLAFSSKVRCVVLLTLPHFFSEKGRQALLAYALVLVVTGPAKNTLNNVGILSESLACGQEQLKNAVKQIIDVIKKPFYALKDAIKKVVETVKKIVKKIKEILLKIKRIIMGIIKIIKAAFEFLAKIISICNKELGTPFERCSRVFENAIADCNAKLGSMFSWLCSLAYIVQSVCYLVKIFDLVCMVVDFISDSIIGVVIRKVKGFVRHIRTMFYVRIKFSHSFHFETNSSKSIAEISKGIVHEIKDRTRTITAIFQFLTSGAVLFFVFMVVRVTMYRHKFLTKNSFDNKFLSKDFHDIDMRRVKIDKETVLPLNDREAKVYVKITSSKLAQQEKKALSKAVMKLATINLKALLYMGIDYALYWILNLINYYGRFQSKVQAPNIPTAHISGNGILADLLKSIVKAFQPMGLQLEIDTVPCLPTPIPPDYDRYLQIGTLLILCWVLTLLEPYGLRMRNVIMSYYHPTRAKQRSIWLYNHILRSRSSFLKFARRQLRRKTFGSKDIEKVTCKEFLSAHFRIFAVCFDKPQIACLLCGTVFRENDRQKPIRCHTPGCAGIYCEQCFADLRNLCTVCLSPIEYGDLSDLSEEKDSSADEQQVPRVKKLVKQKTIKQPKRRMKTSDDSSQYREKPAKWSLFKSCSKSAEEREPHLPLHKKNLEQKRRKLWSIFPKCSKQPSEEDITESQPNKVEILKQPSKSLATDEPTESVPLLDEINLSDSETDRISDYFSSTDDTSSTTTSTDYSYSYQFDKNREEPPPPLEIFSRDIEKQATLDYASMDSFREEPPTVPDSAQPTQSTDTKGTQPQQSIGTVISGETINLSKAERHVEFVGAKKEDGMKKKTKRRKKKKKVPESILCHCFDTDNEDGIEYFEETSLITLPRNSATNADAVFCTCKRPMKRKMRELSDSGSSSFPASSSDYLSSSSEVSSLSGLRDFAKMEQEKDRLGEEMELIHLTDRQEYHGGNDEEEKKPGRLKMLVRRVIPKFKMQSEK
ncbi:unnamed protein product, partial [Phaedon cochleariae]